MPLHIRAATNDDLALLAQLNEPVQSLHAALYPADFKGNVDAANVASFFERAAAKPESSIAIAEQDGLPVGYIWFDISARPENAFKPSQSFVYIHHVSVAADARRRGVGSAMLAYAKEKARAAGVERSSARYVDRQCRSSTIFRSSRLRALHRNASATRPHPIISISQNSPIFSLRPRVRNS